MGSDVVGSMEEGLWKSVGRVSVGSKRFGQVGDVRGRNVTARKDTMQLHHQTLAFIFSTFHQHMDVQCRV
jgi:hypothetical protein